MSLLAPWMLFGLVAAALPVVIHLVGRRRAHRKPFAAIGFLLRSNPRVARMLRLRQLALLALRVLLIVGIAVMMAKPAWQTESPIAGLSSGPQSVVLVIDDTLSMRRQVDGETLFGRAQRAASKLVDTAGAQAELAVISVSAPNGPLVQLSRDSRRVKRAIKALQPTYRHAQLTAAIGRASQLLASARSRPRRLVVISDMAAHGIPDRLPELAADIGIHPVDVSRTPEPDNHAVIRLRAETSGAPGRRSRDVVARLCNHGKGKFDAEAVLRIDGRDLARRGATIGPGECVDRRFHHAFGKSGTHRVTVALPADDLPQDDARVTLVEVRADIRVLLVNGSPSSVRHRDELFYLETALETGSGAEQPIQPRSVRVDDLQPDDLGATDVVVLANVGHLRRSQAEALERRVNEGGGLLIALGDRVSAQSANESLGALLPRKLRGPVAARGRNRDKVMRFGRFDLEHPALAPIWSAQGKAGLMRAHTRKAFRLEPGVGRGRRVIISFDDGSPALLESPHGKGRVLLFVSTLDRDWTDLPIRPGFLPLMQQLIRYLAHAPTSEPRRVVSLGSVEQIPVPSGSASLRLTAPGSAERVWTRAELQGRDEVEVSVDRPGFYRLTAEIDGRLRSLPAHSFVANTDPVESDLRQGRLPEKHVGPARGERLTRQVELWHALGLALLLILALESFLCRRG